MKHYLILICFLFFLLCNGRNVALEIEQKEEMNFADSSLFDEFDWDKSVQLKQELLANLKKKTLSADVAIIRFLTELDEIEEKFNEVLFNRKDYEDLNSLIFSDKKDIKPIALQFEQKAKQHGFNIDSGEGYIYLIKSTTFIKSSIIDILDPISVKFINLYCEEIDKPCCEDAGIIISKKQLVDRVFRWGELLEEVENLKYEQIVHDEYYLYLSFLYHGTDNTPAFDWNTKKFDKEAFNSMRNIVNTHPNSKAAIEFVPFLELLQSANMKETKEVSDFLKKRFETED